MNPSQIRNAYYRGVLTYFSAIRMLIETGGYGHYTAELFLDPSQESIT